MEEVVERSSERQDGVVDGDKVQSELQDPQDLGGGEVQSEPQDSQDLGGGEVQGEPQDNKEEEEEKERIINKVESIRANHNPHPHTKYAPFLCFRGGTGVFRPSTTPLLLV